MFRRFQNATNLFYVLYRKLKYAFSLNFRRLRINANNEFINLNNLYFKEIAKKIVHH